MTYTITYYFNKKTGSYDLPMQRYFEGRGEYQSFNAWSYSTWICKHLEGI